MPLLYDLCCKEGGAGKGYADAGFDVVGIDIEAQPRYPYAFRKASAIAVLLELLKGELRPMPDAFHASPPCQRFSITQRLNGIEHPDLIGMLRYFLNRTGRPYVIENVMGARDQLRAPVMLCGAMFGLRTYRHRLFEANFPLTVPEHPVHVAPTAKMGRPVQPHEFIHAVGNFNGAPLAREDWGMPWATRPGLAEAIPPVYAEHVGRQLLEAL